MGGARDERGQVLALFAVFLVVLLGFLGLVVDLGAAFYVKRATQRTADAAALAAAQELPDDAATRSEARDYYDRNPVSLTQRETLATTLSCRATLHKDGTCPTDGAGRPIPNVVAVKVTSRVPTMFLQFLGMPTVDVSATGTACRPCADHPVDVMMVLDRSGSMTEMGTNGKTKIDNARDAVLQLAGDMQPRDVRLGLAVFFPARTASRSDVCQDPPASMTATDVHVVVPLSNDYKTTSGALNPASGFVDRVNCVTAMNATEYTAALADAQNELDRNGRRDADHVIILLTDGAANTGPPPGWPGADPSWTTRPCGSAADLANEIRRDKGTVFYTVGYAVGDLCEGGVSPRTILEQIAGDKGRAFYQPQTGDLKQIFRAIAIDIQEMSLIAD